MIAKTMCRWKWPHCVQRVPSLSGSCQSLRDTEKRETDAI
jgi:hypothetical protein